MLCPICTVPMRHPYSGGRDNAPEIVTRDHILPKVRGGTGCIYGDVRNVRLICAWCNHSLSKSFHCVATLACARAIAQKMHLQLSDALRSSGISAAGERMLVAEAAIKKSEADRQLRQRLADEWRPRALLADVWPGVAA